MARAHERGPTHPLDLDVLVSVLFHILALVHLLALALHFVLALALALALVPVPPPVLLLVLPLVLLLALSLALTLAFHFHLSSIVPVTILLHPIPQHEILPQMGGSLLDG